MKTSPLDARARVGRRKAQVVGRRPSMYRFGQIAKRARGHDGRLVVVGQQEVDQPHPRVVAPAVTAPSHWTSAPCS